ncbi:MAG: cytochrome c maturation protein CcmE [Bdellovibrionota bacterium]|nr:MAG: cytochrome c maturation protein CcmE [Bdellovibrionota bacterium]
MGKFISLIFAAVVVCGLLVFQATRSSATTMHLPSELGGASPGERVRVAGRVADSEVVYETQPALLLKFRIMDPPAEGAEADAGGRSVAVTYRGVKPDMFAVGRDVILEGYLRGGTLEADQLMTQCPSKYEAPDPSSYHKAP